MDGFDCTTAAGALAGFVEELSNWYVRLNRRRFWDGDATAFATLRHCLITLANLLAPFTPVPRRRDLHQPRRRRPTRTPSATAQTPSTSATSREVDEALMDDQLEAGMEAVRRTVELGRAARAQAKVKLRQPLRKAVVVASDAERAAIERLAEVVASELNVKELDFVHSEAELVSYRVRPNYRSLGPRFGKKMPQAAAAVEALDAERGGRAARGRRRGRHRDRRQGAHPLRRRHQPGHGAARGLPGGGRGGPRRRARAGARRRAAPRGTRPRGRPRRPGGAQAGRPRGLRPDSLWSSPATTSCSRRPGSTRSTSRERRWRTRSATARTARESAPRSRAASC